MFTNIILFEKRLFWLNTEQVL